MPNTTYTPNTISPQVWEQVLSLDQQGYKPGQIARHLALVSSNVQYWLRKYHSPQGYAERRAVQQVQRKPMTSTKLRVLHTRLKRDLRQNHTHQRVRLFTFEPLLQVVCEELEKELNKAQEAERLNCSEAKRKARIAARAKRAERAKLGQVKKIQKREKAVSLSTPQKPPKVGTKAFRDAVDDFTKKGYAPRSISLNLHCEVVDVVRALSELRERKA